MEERGNPERMLSDDEIMFRYFTLGWSTLNDKEKIRCIDIIECNSVFEKAKQKSLHVNNAH